MASGLSICLAFAFSLICVGRAGIYDLALAAAFAALAGIWARLIHKNAARRIAISFRHFAAFRRALLHLPVATVSTAATLTRVAAIGGAPGFGAITRFRPGPDKDARAGERAVAILAACLAPDSFVVRMERGRSVMRIHRIVAERRARPRWAP